MELGDEICAVAVGDNCDRFPGVLQLNSEGAAVLKYITECDTPEQVQKKLCADYPNDSETDIGLKLCDFLNQLVREGLLIP